VAAGRGTEGHISVLIADGQAPLREGVRNALTGRGFEIVADAVDATSAVAAAERERPDICLVDFTLPGSCMTAVSQIARRVPSTTIVVMAVSADAAQVIAALERGAAGYLLKDIGAEELATVLHAAHAGEPALARSLVPYLIDHVRRGPRRHLVLPTGTVALTPREWDVAELLKDGLATDHIGERLGLSPVTVRRHISSLLKKSGAQSRGALAEMLTLFER
jgi:two-component system, NarL family, nitrate/nitrite response regulator NarL